MKAIYKKELKSYFTSMLGYAMIAFFLLVVGVYFWGVNLSGGSAAIGNTLSNISFVYTVVLPILTMRLLAEEQKQKTDQLLFSTPVSIWNVVIGKFFAVVTVFTFPIVVICTMPLVLKQFGNVLFLKSYSTIFAFWLLGCVMLAFGLFISSLTENQIIAAVVSFAFNIVILLMTSIASMMPATAIASLIGFSVLLAVVAIFIFVFVKNIIVAGACWIVAEAALVIVYTVKSTLFESALEKVLGGISFYSRFNDFVNGNFSIASIIYYITFIVLFLYLAVQSIQKRRWS
ncbi:putative uncharacterized protein [Clostridium sp. CAG:411]|jgi:ABC-2 type transport system permease protein|nr:ABC transporter permease [Lachnospiraceae bacterium]CDE42121.1 putative uncharacterized protein [Clostridium sp. CAG:411]